MDRTVAAVAAGLLLAVPVALVPAAAHSVNRSEPRPAISFSDDVLTWLVTADGAESVRSARPCLEVVDAAGQTTRACALRDRQAEVTRSDGTSFRVPSQTRVADRGWRLRIRLADLSLPAGEVTLRTWCRRDRCQEAAEQMQVPALRLSTCQARGPWLVHEGSTRVGRAVALTFDDGPGPVTGRVLRILRDAGAVATFFQLGLMVDRDPSLEQRIVAAGHVVGNHSYAHPVLNGGDTRELARATRAIVAAGAPRPCLFRAPYGENPPEVVRLARDRGMVTVHWNTDPGDWRGLGADQIVATTLAQTRPGSIMVFHDGEDHRAMTAALPRILSSLKARGYRFLTVPELLRLPVSYR